MGPLSVTRLAGLALHRPVIHECVLDVPLQGAGAPSDADSAARPTSLIVDFAVPFNELLKYLYVALEIDLRITIVLKYIFITPPYNRIFQIFKKFNV